MKPDYDSENMTEAEIPSEESQNIQQENQTKCDINIQCTNEEWIYRRAG